MSKVFDCFPFYDELDLLEIRMNILNYEVDYFVLTEATRAFTGKPKPLYYNNKVRFKKFAHKIRHHVIVDDTEFKPEIDAWQRGFIKRILFLEKCMTVKPMILLLFLM